MHYFLFDNFIIIALVYSIPKYLIYRGWQNQTVSTYSNTLVNGIVTIEEIALVYTLWVLSTIFFYSIKLSLCRRKAVTKWIMQPYRWLSFISETAKNVNPSVQFTSPVHQSSLHVHSSPCSDCRLHTDVNLPPDLDGTINGTLLIYCNSVGNICTDTNSRPLPQWHSITAVYNIIMD